MQRMRRFDATEHDLIEFLTDVQLDKHMARMVPTATFVTVLTTVERCDPSSCCSDLLPSSNHCALIGFWRADRREGHVCSAGVLYY